jgi:hypothetical protein
VVDVPHDRDHGRAWLEPALVELLLLGQLVVLEGDDVRVVSESDCDAVAISPRPNSVLTTSATERCVRSATSCGVEPCTSLSVGRPLPTRSGTGAGSAGWGWAGGWTSAGASGAGAGSGVGGTSGSTRAFGLAFGSGSSTASTSLASGTALPPEARSLGTA